MIALVLLSKKGINAIKSLFDHNTDKITIVIDAGHEGADPGKIGINNVLEKDINLKIAYKLKVLLEQNDIHVIMTRLDQNCLCSSYDKNWKQIDMNKRVKIINQSNAQLAISIHQNSFSQESSKGAQMFYYTGSDEGKVLAEFLQDRIKNYMKDGNHRLAMPNSNYFLLRKSNCPLVIVECGFLTNRKEAALLCDTDYQEKIAWAIHLGIMEYINKYLKNSKYNLADTSKPLLN